MALSKKSDCTEQFTANAEFGFTAGPCYGNVMQETTQTPVTLTAPPDETVNQLTHGIGLALSIVGALHLVTRVPLDGYLWVGIWVYAIALVALFAASTLSHSFVSGPLRTRYRTLDQLCIFAVMAATYTPVSLAVCDEGWWNIPMVLMWLMAGLGIYLKLRVTKEDMVPVWFYVALGAIPALAVPRILEVSGFSGLFWIAAGGACYVLGVIFLTNDQKVRYFHAVWHVLVILGSMCHYIVICDYTLKLA